jgi:hypothetical protein
MLMATGAARDFEPVGIGASVEMVMPNIASPALAPSQRRDLEKFGERLARFGVNFAVVAADGPIAVRVNGGRFESDPDRLLEAGRYVLAKAAEQQYESSDIPSGNWRMRACCWACLC